ncbi:hypothetical protein KBD81_01805 [Candidatus Woesebacteria bacterium]|nr:hypothetical protein [Candidatus Woesebacteria bacterium]
MDPDDKKKYLIFGVFAILFLAGAAYVSSKQNFASQYRIPSIKEMIPPSSSTGEREKPFEFKIPAFTGEEKNRITNENCGISFVIPDGWTVDELRENERYCSYRIDNPYKRGATLELGTPPANKKNGEYIYWEDLKSYIDTAISVQELTIDGALALKCGFNMTRPPDHPPNTAFGYSDPAYFIRKDQAVYFLRYGHSEFENPPDNMLDDISTVVSSFRFTKDPSFYSTPMINSMRTVE